MIRKIKNWIKAPFVGEAGMVGQKGDRGADGPQGAPGKGITKKQLKSIHKRLERLEQQQMENNRKQQQVDKINNAENTQNYVAPLQEDDQERLKADLKEFEEMRTEEKIQKNSNWPETGNVGNTSEEPEDDPQTGKVDELLQSLRSNEITTTKKLRRDIDGIIQEMASMPMSRETVLAITKAEEAVLWLGMNLKRIGTPNPYPNSKDPRTGDKIDPTADGLKFSQTSENFTQEVLKQKIKIAKKEEEKYVHINEILPEETRKTMTERGYIIVINQEKKYTKIFW